MKKLIAIVVTFLFLSPVFAADIKCERSETKVVCTQPATTIEFNIPSTDLSGVITRQNQTIDDLRHEVKILQGDLLTAKIANIELTKRLNDASISWKTVKQQAERTYRSTTEATVSALMGAFKKMDQALEK